MGKIMLNGKQYGVGGIERAEDISYDNTQSGMSATNVQGALDEVKSGLSNLFHMETVGATITKANGSRSSITAPSVSGYTFLCWLSAVSSGWIGNIYVENQTSITTNIWSSNYGYSDTGTGNVIATAMYVKG